MALKRHHHHLIIIDYLFLRLLFIRRQRQTHLSIPILGRPRNMTIPPNLFFHALVISCFNSWQVLFILLTNDVPYFKTIRCLVFLQSIC